MKPRSYVPLLWLLFLLTGSFAGQAAVSIVSQPRSASVIMGDRAVLTVVATGNGTPTYQWNKNGVAISGATSSFLMLNPVAFTDAASYTVDVTDADPSTVTSGTAGLSVNSAKGGDVDFSFNIGNSLDSPVAALAVQSDGKVLIAGNFSTVNGAARAAIARLNSDGSTDYSFGNGLTGADNEVNAVAVQSDGKILVGGLFKTINGTARGGIARLNSDGTLDTTFGNGQAGAGDGSYNNAGVGTIAVQSDGKVLIGGYFSTVNGAVRGAIARLNSDGTLDTSFGSGLAGAGGAVNALALQGDGKVLIGGQFSTVNGTARGCIARLNSDGTLDTAFGSGLRGAVGGESTVDAVAVQTDGKVLIGGSFTTVNGISRGGIARLNSDGTLDTSFGNGPPAVVVSAVAAVAVQNDGKVLIGGRLADFNGTQGWGIARLNSDGTQDTAFGNGQAGASDGVYCLAVQSDGKVLIGGEFLAVDGAARLSVARLSADGTLDTFSNGSAGFSYNSAGAGETVNALAVQSDGKVLVGGGFTTVNGVSQGQVARLNSDGTLDTTFGNVLAGPYVNSLALQTDGRVLIAGTFTSVNGTPRNYLARLNSDGTLDTTFGNGLAGANNGVSAVAVQSDGKVLIGGNFTTVNGISRGGIARLNSDGTLDTTFGNGQAGAGYGSYQANVETIAVQSDGKVLIGGYFTTVNGVARGAIARLNSDGTLDTTFGNGQAGAVNGPDSAGVLSIAVQSDGKVLIGGFFSTVNGAARGAIARLNSDGTLDTTFGNGLAGASELVSALALQGDGKVLIAGEFTTVNGTAHGNIARLNSNGTLDTTFGNGLAGTNDTVFAMAVQSDGKVLIGGEFTTVNGIARSILARLQYSKVDADLSALALSAGTVSPTFDPGSITYAAGVATSTSSLSVTPTIDDPAAAIQVQVNGGSYATVVSGNASSALPLNPGSNTVEVQVTSADTTVVKTYTINVQRMTALDTWNQTYFGNSTVNTGPANSYTGDGIANLAKFAFGLNPMVAGGPALQYTGALTGGGVIASNGMPITVFQSTGNGSGLRALFVRRSDYLTAGVVYTPYFSGDLISWQASTDTPTVLADNGSYQVISVPYPSSSNGKSAYFVRVQLSLPP